LKAIKYNKEAFAKGINGGIGNAALYGHVDCITALLGAIKDDNDAFSEGIKGGIEIASAYGEFDCLIALLDAIKDGNKDAFAEGINLGIERASSNWKIDCLLTLLEVIKDDKEAFASGINGGIRNASAYGRTECLSALLEAIEDDNKNAFSSGVLEGLRLAREKGHGNCVESLTAFIQKHSITDNDDDACIRTLGLECASDEAIRKAESCPICHENYEKGNGPILALPCNTRDEKPCRPGVLHRSCVLEMVRPREGHPLGDRSCPMCRVEIQLQQPLKRSRRT
jgi:hypothetical protein